ncbi:MAG: hypothetical protein LBS99_05780 [Clostridiales bacterium]|nr:hypothetical protein [Clostridiales bacterium]
MNKRPDKDKSKPVDTGETFCNMNVEGFRWYDAGKDEPASSAPRLNKKERRAAVKASFSATIMPFLFFIAALTLAALGLYLWLK